MEEDIVLSATDCNLEHTETINGWSYFVGESDDMDTFVELLEDAGHTVTPHPDGSQEYFGRDLTLRIKVS